MKLLDILDGVPIPIAYRMAFLTNFYREPLLRRMEQQFGIIRPEWTILICLVFRDRLNPRDICEITEQPRNTVSRAAATLVKKGLIVREDDSADARRAILRLTAEGRDLYGRIMPMFEERESKMLECLSQAERNTLAALLDRLARATPSWAD
ncbi:MAG: MarR family winged helix-turn-helix transcriptional regulator [Inquilinaceae bacterium]